jgi:hypothetical protein
MKTTIRPHTIESPMPLVSSSWISPAPASTVRTDDAERFTASRFCASTDETVAIDERSELTPSQAVENRLVALLSEASLPVSHLQMRRGLMVRGRRDD